MSFTYMNILKILLVFFAFGSTILSGQTKGKTGSSKTTLSKTGAKSSSKGRQSYHKPRLSPIMQMPESIIVLPPDYDENVKYPLLILMPYTGGSSIDFFNKYLREAKIDTASYAAQFEEFLEIYRAEYGEERSFILMLTHGDGSTAHHNFDGFSSCIDQMESRVFRDLKKFKLQYSIDNQRIFIGGVSLGGDLSWALSLRNPELLQGAIVTASRCSYPPPAGVLSQLAQKNYSFFMVMGMNESPDRLNGIRYARQLLNQSGVEHSYREMPYLEHDRAPIWLFMEGIEYVMFTPHAPIEKISDSLKIASVCRIYGGELIAKKYKIEEKQEILHRGGGLWHLQNETISQVNLRICSNESRQVLINIDDDNFGKAQLMAYLTYNKEGELALVVPEQVVGNYKYKGIAADINAQQHGFFSISALDKFLTLDVEKSSVSQPNNRTIFSFFALLN